METAERIVEAYVRHVKKWATITNVECEGGHEIDVIAIGAGPADRWHVEVIGSIDPAWQHLTPAYLEDYVSRKFDPQPIRERLAEYGFAEAGYQKVLVVWDWSAEAVMTADQLGVTLLALPQVLRLAAQAAIGQTAAFTDDVMRLFQLLQAANMLQLDPGPEDA